MIQSHSVLTLMHLTIFTPFFYFSFCIIMLVSLTLIPSTPTLLTSLSSLFPLYINYRCIWCHLKVLPLMLIYSFEWWKTMLNMLLSLKIILLCLKLPRILLIVFRLSLCSGSVLGMMVIRDWLEVFLYAHFYMAFVLVLIVVVLVNFCQKKCSYIEQIFYDRGDIIIFVPWPFCSLCVFMQRVFWNVANCLLEWDNARCAQCPQCCGRAFWQWVIVFDDLSPWLQYTWSLNKDNFLTQSDICTSHFFLLKLRWQCLWMCLFTYT